jgi:hypothetical protein
MALDWPEWWWDFYNIPNPKGSGHPSEPPLLEKTIFMLDFALIFVVY